MVNILLEGYNIGERWLYRELKNYIKPSSKVAVVAFSFRESKVKNAEDWSALYGKGGCVYCGIVEGLKAYGVTEESVSFINYFVDDKASATQKINAADIIYFTGGLPDKAMARLQEFDLLSVLKNYGGTVMGYSAGALIQLSEYHLSPDKDYPRFNYYKGLPYLNGFYLEVHYNSSEAQSAAIKRVLNERKKTVYATTLMKGAIVADNGRVKLIGDVKTFNAP